MQLNWAKWRGTAWRTKWRLLVRPAVGLILLARLGAAAARADDWANPLQPDAASWDTIRAIAKAYVDKESPLEAFPFPQAPVSVPSPSGRKVFAHYFPPYPLSFDNLPAGRDYYAEQYMKRSGEGGKYSKVGGLVRDRPLPVGPWQGPYWRQINYAIEVLRAQRMGLDGFALDIVQLVPGRYSGSQQMLLDVAAAVAPQFRIMPEPDSGILRNASPQDLAAFLLKIARHPASYRLADGRLVVAPFWAEARGVEFWKQMEVDMASKGVPIALLPVLLDASRYSRDFASFAFGLSSWGSRNPGAEDLRTSLERAKSAPGQLLQWMMPIAPQDVRPKNSSFWETENTSLYRHQWAQAISGRYQYVHLITWNDYSESTEVAPSLAPQFVFYDLGAYYAQWFRMGRAPPITREALYFSHRRQVVDQAHVAAMHDIPMTSHGGIIKNLVEMVAFLTTPATLQIQIGDHLESKDAGPGIQDFHVDARPGHPVFRIVRAGKTIIETPSGWEIKAEADVEDPVYAGGSSTRHFVPIR